MHELTDIISLCRNCASHPVALATIVKVVGSHYSQPGARLLITSDGQVAGTISGSCLEEDLRERAKKILESGEPALVEYNMSAEDDIVFGLGLGCGGEVSVLIEPLPANSVVTFLNSVDQRLQSGEPAATALVFRAEHGSEIPVGSRLMVSDSAIMTETSSGLQSLTGLREDIKNSLRNRRSQVKSYLVGALEVEVFIEYHAPPPSLIICGAGNCAEVLVRFANELGWNTSVVDHRGSLVKPERFAGAIQVVCLKPDEIIERLKPNHNTAVVILTHNYLVDLELIRAFLLSGARYIGLLSSRDRFRRLLHDLQSPSAALGESLDECQLSRIYSPVGLDIGAKTSAEIALSVTAEIQAVFAGKDAISLRNKNAVSNTRNIIRTEEFQR